VPKCVGVLTIDKNCISLSEFVGGYTDCKNMHDMNNIKFQRKLRLPKADILKIEAEVFFEKLVHLYDTILRRESTNRSRCSEWAVQLRNRGLIPGRSKRFSFSSQGSDRLLGPPSLLLNGQRGLLHQA
jgi:hypothetical protein